MNFGELKTLGMASLPQASARSFGEANLALLINLGAVDIAAKSLCLPKYDTFSVIAEQQEYDLSSIVDRFLVLDKGGVWWSDGSSWRELYPKSIAWLNEQFPGWRSLGSGDPIYYYQIGNSIGFHPKPDTSLTDGFGIHFAQAPLTMSSDTEYPFGGTSLITRLLPLHRLIIQFLRVEGFRILSKEEKMIAEKTIYESELQEQIILLDRARDTAANEDSRMMGPRFSGSYRR